MTLIFSNNNRSLFNIESSNQTLELSYGKRFTASVNYKQLSNQASTLYKPYFENSISANFLTNLKSNLFFAYAYNPKYKARETNLLLRAKLCFALQSKMHNFAVEQKPEKIKKKLCVAVDDQVQILAKPSAPVKSSILKGKDLQEDLYALRTSANLGGKATCPFGQRSARRKALFTDQIEDLYRKHVNINQKLVKGFVYNPPSIINDSSSKNRKPTVVFLRCKTTLFDLVNNQDTASLALQSFSAIEILSLYGFLKNQPILLQNFFKKRLLYVQTLVFRDKHVSFFLQQDSPIEEKPTRLSNRLKIYSFGLKQDFLHNTSTLQKKSMKASRALYNAMKPIRKNNKISFSTCFNIVKSKSNTYPFREKAETKPENENEQPSFGKYCKKATFITLQKRLIDRLLVNNCLTFFKEKVFTIKRFLPKTRVWAFAFGSSFLVITITSILQRQQQNHWFLTVLKNQMPGLSISSQQSSWECLENITLKHISNKRKCKYKYPSSKNLVQQIDCYKNIFCLSLCESWNQQALQNYTAVFSKSFDEIEFSQIKDLRSPVDIFFKFYPSNASKLEINFERSPKHIKNLKKSIRTPINFRSLSEKRDKQTTSSLNLFLPISTSGDRRLFANQKFALVGSTANPKKPPFSCLSKDLPSAKKWLAQPWYTMHARVLSKRNELTLNGRSNVFAKQDRRETAFRFRNLIKKCTSFYLFRDKIAPFNINGYRDKIHFENDSIPSKMSCATKVNFYRPHDRLKKLFYTSNNFSIDTQIFQENLQESDPTYAPSFAFKENNSNLEKLVDRSRFLFLQKKSSFELDSEAAQHEKTYFDCPLAIVKSESEKKDCKNAYKSSCKSEIRTCVQSLSKSAEKVSTYFLCKQNSISNRLMSGYQLPETKALQLKKEIRKKGGCLNKIFIKVPPALPFYESRIKSLFENDFFFTKSIENEQLLKEKLIVSPAKRVSQTNQVFPRIRSFKKLPYRKLSLNELKEVEPLFNQVNKSFRVSPYHFTFKKLLFTDYYDYLGWSKDTPAAISILPSVEEEQVIKDSWFADQARLKERLEGKKSVDRLQTENESNLSSLKNQSESKGSTPSVQEETVSTFISMGEDEDKKREITKFEWLKQVREAEHLVEKRKKLQELAYPNQKALFSKRLQARPGMIQSLFVSDRKLSFFGISNIFPKRLVAQDQKQINSQILRDEEDRRSAFLVDHIFLKNDDINRTSGFVLENKEDLSIENLLKSGALYNLEKSNEFNLKKQFVSGSTKTSSDKEIITPKPDEFRSTSNKSFYKAKLCASKPVSKKELLSSVRTTPRNRQERNGTKNDNTGSCNVLLKPMSALFTTRQHPIYMPHRRLRLRAPQLSLSSQNSNPQSRIDDLNLNQSHRWWQKRRSTSSLLGAPSKRYLVMPEITTKDWKKIIEWQLKTYFLEEEKRLESLVLERAESQNLDFSLPTSFTKEMQESGPNSFLMNQGISHDNSNIVNGVASQTKHLFKIKRIAVYLPWTTLKKSLKKPFEWPLTGLSYSSFGFQTSTKNESILKPSLLEKEKPSRDFVIWGLRPGGKPRRKSIEASYKCKSWWQSHLPLRAKICKKICMQSFVKNKKAQPCFISSISPHFKTSFLSLPNQRYKSDKFKGDTLPNLATDAVANGLHENSVYKPFLFETIDQSSYLLIDQVLLALATKQLFQSIYKIFGNVITYKLKNSSLAVFLLPLFFNAAYKKNQISEYSNLKKRLRDLVGNEDTISALSEIVWYLRNACRGRHLPRGIVLVETLSSESTNYLKAVGGEAQVPVIVQSLRALPFTQNHPQRRLEKILTFAQKRAPCILFLDDLDSIGQSRTLLLKNNSNHLSRLKTEFFSFVAPANQISGSNVETFEKRKWKNDRGEFDYGTKRELCTALPKVNRRFVLGAKQSFVKSGKPFFCHSNYRSTQLNKSSSSLWSKPFDQSKSINGRETEDNGVLHLSETEKIVQQRRVDLMLRLLTVMDGITHLNGVLIVTTSKNPRSLDPALLRPGRFEKLINLKLPNKKKRIDLLKVETAKIGHMNFMPWEYLGTKTEDMTGTEISSAINHSAFRAIIQSTVHTFSTLEYGISCVNGHKFPIEKPKGELEDCFDQKGKKYCSSLIQTSQASKQTPGTREETTKNNNKSKVVLSFELTQPINRNRRSTFFQKSISVHNPYKTFLKKGVWDLGFGIWGEAPQKPYKSLPFKIEDFTGAGGKATKICNRSRTGANQRFARRFVIEAPHVLTRFNDPLQRVVKMPSQISFYQAGRGVIRSSILSGTRSLRFFSSEKQDKSFKSNTSCRTNQRFVSVAFNKNGRTYKGNCCTTRSYFAKKLVQLYGGQACESFYLDSIACFKNKKKKFTTLFSQLSFLQSTLSSKETLHASSLIEDIKTNFQCYSLKNCCKRDCSRHKRSQRLYNTFFCKKKVSINNVRKLRSLSSTNFSKKGFSLEYNAFASLRKQLQLYTDYDRNNFVQFSSPAGKNCCCFGQICRRKFVYPTVQKVSETIKVFQRQSGSWYRIYIPKLEQNQSNREWVLPDIFFYQHVSYLKQKDLQNRLLPRQPSSKVCFSVFSSRKKPYCSRFDFVDRNECFDQKQNPTSLAYYNMVLSAFYIAFQNCHENREFLDILSDHLIRFKIVRLHEIVRIGTFYF